MTSVSHQEDVELARTSKMLQIYRTYTRRELAFTFLMMILNVSPLFVMLIVQRWDYRLGLGVAALWALVLFIGNYILYLYGLSLVKVHSLHVAFIVIMGGLFAISFAVPYWFYHTWFRPIFHWCIALFALTGFVIRRPFVMDFLEGAYHEDVVKHPVVHRYAMYATIPWIISLSVNAACSTIKDGVGLRKLAEAHLAIVVALVIPIIFIVGACVATAIIRRRLNRALERMFPQDKAAADYDAAPSKAVEVVTTPAVAS